MKSANQLARLPTGVVRKRDFLKAIVKKKVKAQTYNVEC